MASRDALILGALAAGGLGAYVISQRGAGGAEAEEDPMLAAGGIDPLTGLPFPPGVGLGGLGNHGFVGGDGGLPDWYAGDGGSPEDDPFFTLAEEQGQESLDIQREGEASRSLAAWTETGLIAAGTGVVVGTSLAAHRRGKALARAAKGSASVRTTPRTGQLALPERAGPASRTLQASKSAQAARTTQTASRASRAASAAQRAGNVARTVVKTPAVRTAGRVVGRAAPALAVGLSTASGVSRGQRAQREGYSRNQSTAIAASEAAIRVGTLGLAGGDDAVRARNAARRAARRVDPPSSLSQARRNAKRNLRRLNPWG